MSTVRLTVAQALVRFLASQYSERDGVRQRLIAGCFGIFGHGNVAGRRPGPAPGARDRRGGPEVLPGPQRAGDGARVGRLRPDAEPAAGLRLHRLDRPGLDQHGDRRRAGHHQPHPGPAAAQRLLRHPGRQPGAAGARGPAILRRQRQRRVPAGVAVLGPDQPPGAAAVGAAGRDAGAHRPGRDRRGDARAAAGRAGRGPTTGQKIFSPNGPGTCLAHCPSPPPWTGPSRCFGPRARRSSSRAAASSTPRPARRCAGFAEATGIPVADTQAGKGALAWDHPGAVGGVGATGSPVANALAREADVVLGIGTRYSDFTTASRTAFQHPGRAVRQPQRRGVRRRQARGRRAGRRRAGRP